MKKFNFKLSALATDDIEEIQRYYKEKEDGKLAIDITQKITKSIRDIGYFPFIGRVREDGTREKLIPKLPYIVMYRIQGDTIFISRIYHTSRKWFD